MKKEKENIQILLAAYASAIDTQNTQEAGSYMDANFRVVLNNYNDLPEPVVISKEQYLNRMQEGKVGGNQRSVYFEFIDVNISVAIAKLI